MSEHPVPAEETTTDLQKLRTLLDHLDRAVSQQRHALAGRRADPALPASDHLLHLLQPLKNTLEQLSRRVEAQDKERQQLRVIQDVSATINSSLDIAEVLNVVVDAIISLIGAERGFLFLVDEDSGKLEVQVARNRQGQNAAAAAREISRTIIDTVFDSGVPVVTTNAQDDPRFARQESIVRYDLRSVLCVPLTIKQIVLGVIYVDNRVATGIFNEADRDLLAAFANQAAVAIENARMFHQIRDQLADITEMKYLMDNVFESMASGVLTIDTNERISMYNQAAERILGISPGRVLTHSYQEVLTGVSDIVKAMVQQVLAHGSTRYVEVDTSTVDRPGTTSLALNCSPLRDLQQQTLGVAIVVDDVTEKKQLESVRRYLPGSLVDQVRNLDAAQRPQREILTILFADVRGFSTFSEFLAPEELIEVINRYFTVATQAIAAEGGLVDKFMGDAVMALFNTPLNPQADHAARAVRAALAMQQQVAEVHADLPAESRLFFGTGIHTGEAVAGNVGSHQRKDYSAIGDAVNLAKRLQEIAQPQQVLLSEATYALVKTWVAALPLPPTVVKGRKTPVQLYQLTGLKASS